MLIYGHNDNDSCYKTLHAIHTWFMSKTSNWQAQGILIIATVND